MEKVKNMLIANGDTLINQKYLVGRDCQLILNNHWVDGFLKISGMEYDPSLNTKARQ